MNDVVGRGTLLAGRYRVLLQLPSTLEGASTWSATDQILDRPVHVTILTAGNVSQALDAARRASLVSDPRLARILDVSESEGVGYVVGEQVTGPSLAEIVARGPLPAGQARALIGEAASALEVARRRGVHHLALRPSVLHVTTSGRVALAGLALDAALLGQGLGDARTTTRADTVGLVRLLYTALTGRWPTDPFASEPQGSGVKAAPMVHGSPAAPADLVAGVPNDLDTLCVVTLGSNDDGPHSPAELISELEPWGELKTDSLLRMGENSVTVQSLPIPLVEPSAASGDATPGTVQRQSVRSTFDSAPPVAASRPGTPPPAIPPRNGSRQSVLPAEGVSASALAMPPLPPVGGTPLAATTPPASPPVPVTSARTVPPPFSSAGPGVQVSAGASGMPPTIPPSNPAGIPRRTSALPGGARAVTPATVSASAMFSGDAPFDSLVEEEPLVERRFDPTKLVLAVVVIAVLIGVFIAMKSLVSPIGTRAPDAAPAATTSTSAPATGGASTAATPSTAPTAATGGVPTIASITALDPPPGDGEEHSDIVGRAFDGDPSTFWMSSTYNQPNMGGKPGIGLALTLTKSTTVTSVTVHVNGNGGMVEVRATDAANPSTGPALASGPMSADTVLTLSKPTETGSLVLWFTSVPTTADGKNRVEVNEITLS